MLLVMYSFVLFKMWYSYLFIVLGCILHSHTTFALWTCTQDSDCANLSGSVCDSGSCVCPVTQQVVLGGTVCADYAPYFLSPCMDDYQCGRLFTTYECTRQDGQIDGTCGCQPNHHYFLGRCWPNVGYGESCTRDEECMGAIRDPYSFKCDETCVCADGYYRRQRGECRRMGSAVGERCVIDQDCQFSGGACDVTTFTCIDTNNTEGFSSNTSTTSADVYKMAAKLVQQNGVANVTHRVSMTRQNGVACDLLNPCAAPFECFGVCACPRGYYPSADGSACLAELGSPATAEQCTGLLAEVQDGICTCPSNFFFAANMRDCTKVARRLSDACVNDDSCHTFGPAARCGPPGQFEMRACECDPEESVWDAQQNMCRLFAGVGEACQEDSDCLAGELEIQCVLDDAGAGYCACPPGLTAVAGLCLTTGLELGDACQSSLECTETPNTVCEGGRCSCDAGYQENNGVCAALIGGSCTSDSDCVIEHTVCQSGSNGDTCQCAGDYVADGDICWPSVSGYNSTCSVDAQCTATLGASGACQDGLCLCGDEYHFRDGGCWERTGLFDTCLRSSQCFLGELTDRVVCRNGLCQCHFDYPYSEELRTCETSASSRFTASTSVIFTVLIYLYSN